MYPENASRRWLCMFIALNLLSVSPGALAQSPSGSGSSLTIQTSPPDPFEASTLSGGGATVSGSISSTASGSSATRASVSAPATSAPQGFPQQCGKECSVVATALQRCNPAQNFNATCLCTTEIEQGYLQCVECALAESGSKDTSAFQALINAYIDQCKSAPYSATTLPNVTVTIPPTSSASNSSAASKSSSHPSSSKMSSSTSSMAPSSASSAPAQTSGGAPRTIGTDSTTSPWGAAWIGTLLFGGAVAMLL